MLLQMFAAVVVGGTTLGGGRGGPLGTVFGAYILMMVVNILLVLNVSAYYSTVAEGSILILAVLAGSAAPGLAARPRICASLILRMQARARRGSLPSAAHAEARLLALARCSTSGATRRRRHAQLSCPQRGGAALRAACLCLLRRSSSSPRRSHSATR